jgi:protein tyrosine phosphatase (PTP) superfamily phosphohydrolase (DUF442 family)
MPAITLSATTHPARRTALRMLAVGIAVVCVGARAAEAPLRAPNVVPIYSTLVTSGQPTADALAHLAAQGFGAVIYLAPPSVSDAVPAEADIARQQGMEFVNIPIAFNNPTQADFQAFVAAMGRLGDRKVLVHCQVNMRASSMTFLHRVIVRGENPEQAYEAVAKVWSPQGPWKHLLVAELGRVGIAFDPY